MIRKQKIRSKPDMSYEILSKIVPITDGFPTLKPLSPISTKSSLSWRVIDVLSLKRCSLKMCIKQKHEIACRCLHYGLTLIASYELSATHLCLIWGVVCVPSWPLTPPSLPLSPPMNTPAALVQHDLTSVFFLCFQPVEVNKHTQQTNKKTNKTTQNIW